MRVGRAGAEEIVGTKPLVALLCCAAVSWTALAQAQEEPPPAEEAVEAAVPVGNPQAAEDPVLPPTPTLDGATGLFRLRSALTSPELSARLWLSGQIFSGEDVVRTNDEDSRFLGSLGLSVSALPWLEPYLVLGARSNTNTFSTPEAVLAQGDTTLGSKALLELDPTFSIGADLGLLFLTGAESTTFDFAATSLRFSALATFDGTRLADGAIPLRAHLNLGYFLDNSDQLLPEDDAGRKLIPSRVERFSQGLSAFDQVQLGLGVEVPLPYITPSIEYNLGIWTGSEPDALCADQPLDCPSKAGFGANPQVLTLGVKTMPTEALIASLGLDVGLTTNDAQGTPTTPPWNVLFGLGFAFDPQVREKVVFQDRIVEKVKLVDAKPKVGVFVGKVLDEDTGKPIPGALIKYPGKPFTAQSAGEEDGAYTSYEIEPAEEVEIEVSAPEYKTAKLTEAIKEGQNDLNIKLKPEGKTGEVVVEVLDEKGDPATGTVRLTGPKVYEVKLEEGRAVQKVLVGTYTVALTSPGYLTVGRDLEVAPKKKSEVTLKLAPRPKAAVVQLVEDRIVLDEKLSFQDAILKPEAGPLLDQVAALLLERPDFSLIRIEAHVDTSVPANKRAELTQAWANAVRDYLTQRGIDPKRLEAKGYAAEKPLVPDTSALNRSINRRVEFVIVSKRAE